MQVIRTLVLSAVLAVGVAAPVAAQTSSTSTTMPPVRSIPVTPAPTVTTAPPATTSTTAPATAGNTATGGTETAAPPMADTGLAADKLVPFGFLLIGLGAALTGGARRVGRVRYNFL